MGLAGCWTLIKYAIWPPTVPDREELLDRDEKTGVARPKEEWKKQRYGAWSFGGRCSLRVLQSLLLLSFLGPFLLLFSGVVEGFCLLCFVERMLRCLTNHLLEFVVKGKTLRINLSALWNSRNRRRLLYLPIVLHKALL